ncbi:MAG: ATP-binding protein [Polyangiales bacterium]
MRGLTGVTALAWTLFTLRDAFHHAPKVALVNAVTTAVLAILWTRIRHTNVEKVAHAVLAVAVSSLVVTAMFSGQGASRAVWFFVAAPLFAAQTLGRRATMLWALLAGLAMIVVHSSGLVVSIAPEFVSKGTELLVGELALLAVAFAFAATARRVHENELSARALVTGRLSAVLDSLPEGVCFVGQSGERIANRQLAILFDLSEAVPTMETLARRTREPVNLLRTHALLREARRRTLGVIVELTNGRILELDYVPIEAEGGELWAFRDVTERTLAERVKSDFLAIVSHELRTPLTAIHGAVRMLENDVAGPVSDDAKSLLSIASENTMRLGRVVDDLLDLQRIEAGKLSLQAGSVDLCGLLDRVLDRYEREAKSAQVELSIDYDSLPRVPGEDRRLEQVFANLVGNAIKFSPRGGVVTVRAVARDGCVRIEVSDQGPGIRDGDRTRVFEKFVQLEDADTRQKGGTGLGLAIAKGIVESHGGAIGLVPRPHGSTFWVELPSEAA